MYKENKSYANAFYTGNTVKTFHGFVEISVHSKTSISKNNNLRFWPSYKKSLRQIDCVISRISCLCYYNIAFFRVFFVSIYVNRHSKECDYLF